MKPTIIIFTFLFSIHVSAQPSIQWQKCLGGSCSDYGYAIQQTGDGGYIVAGFSYSNDGNVNGNHDTLCNIEIEDYWIVKLNSVGTIQWQKCFGGYNAEKAYSVIQTSDSGYAVAGYTLSNDGDVSGNHGGDDYWIIKLDNLGNLQWQKCFGGTNVDVAESIEQTSDGGYIIAGWTYSNDGDVSGNHSTGQRDYWVIKINAFGNLLWQKCLGGTGDDLGYSIKQCFDNGFIVTGRASSDDGDVTGNHPFFSTSDSTWHPSSDVWIVKLDSNGVFQWQNCLGGTGYDVAFSIQQTADSGFIAGSYSGSNDGDVSGNHFSLSSDDYWIVKLDASGNLQWAKCFGGSHEEFASEIIQTTDGGYVIGGSAISTDGDVTCTNNHEEYWIIKLNDIGDLQWQKCLGGTYYQQAEEIKQTNDGGLIVVGFTASDDGDVIGNHGGTDYWVVKLSTITDVPAYNDLSATSISPNPTQGMFSIILPQEIKNATIHIYDCLGKEIYFTQKTDAISGQDISIKAIAGVYFVKITDENNQFVKKLIVQ